MSNLKKVLLAISVFVIAAVMGFSQKVNASTEEFEYLVDIEGNAVISSYVGNKSDVRIPSTIDGKEVVGISIGAFVESYSVKTIYVPETVKGIAIGAFLSDTIQEINVDSNNKFYMSENGILYNKDQTELITLPLKNKTVNYVMLSTVTQVDMFAIVSNYKLETISLSKNLKEIAENGLIDCGRLKNISIADTNAYYTTVDGCLYNKKKTTLLMYSAAKPQTYFKIPDGVVGFIEGTFYACNNLKTIELSNTVKNIDGLNFGECFNLQNFKVASGNKYYSVQDGVLYNKSKTKIIICPYAKKTITLPATTRYIDELAFDDCQQLSTIKVASSNKYLSSVDGVLYNKKKSTLKLCPMGKKGTLKIPSGTKNIDSFAFDGCSRLTAVVIPDSVKNIEILNFIDMSEKFYIICNKGSEACTYAKDMELPYRYNFASVNVKLSTEVKYTGANRRPSVTVKSGSKVLKRGVDYTVSYVNNKNIGKARVIIKGKGKYAGTVKKTFKIVPGRTTSLKQSKTTYTSKIKLTWNKVKGATGYEVYRATAKDGKYRKIKTLKSKSFTDSSLESGTNYYYKVRAYKKVSGKKVYGTYSKVVTMKTK